MTKISEYTKELLPRIRRAEQLKEYIKDFKTTDENAVRMVQNIKDAQAALKAYLATSEASEWIEELNSILQETKEGAKAATKDSAYKPAVYRTFLNARAKEKEQDTIKKGEVFENLVKEIEE